MTRTLSHGWRIIATFFGVSLASVEILLNASFMANGSSLLQPMVAAVVIITAAGSASLPIAERAWQSGSRWKAVALVAVFFPLALAISFTSALDRSVSRRDGELADHRASFQRQSIAQEVYNEARRAQQRDCGGRSDGSAACRRAEIRLSKAGEGLIGNVTTAAQQAEDGMAQSIVAMLSFAGVSEERVRLYVPLLTPLAMLVGGILFLAIGLAPTAGSPVEASPVPSAAGRITSKSAALRELTRLSLSAGPKGYAFRSERHLARLIGASPASLNLWMREWRGDKFTVVREGKMSFLRITKPKIVKQGGIKCLTK